MKILLLFSWLFLIPILQILSCTKDVLVVSGQCLEDQRSLLLKLKDSLATNSTKLGHWNNSSNCCHWDEVGCDSLGRVIRLELDNLTITGQLGTSTSLFNLQYLERLNLAYDSFNSTIPTGLFELTNLIYLNLSNAGFFGQIPIDLSRMRRLVILDFSTRFPLVQTLKMEKPNLKSLVQDLTELQELHLDGVNISAQGGEWCDALSSLSNLRVLSLSSCHLSGPINSSLLKLRSLSNITLDNNKLSTTVPDFFMNFSNLTSLSLGSCDLRGEFPENILQLPKLQDLDLSQNKLITGRLPQFPLGGSLRKLALRYTSFSGSLPDSIGFLGALSSIDLSNCNFTGPIPSTMENLNRLVNLDFSFNKFNGSIPSFRKSKNLRYIDLSRNDLTGTILSTPFEGLANLSFINLGFNSLSGSIPSSLLALPSLRTLQLPNNKFKGKVDEFPNASASLLETLDLSGNQLNGSIPNFFFDLRRLRVLSLSSNSFSGSLQLEVINRLANLTILELSHYNLSIDASSSNSSQSVFPQLSVLKLASCKLKTFPNLKNQFKMIQLDLSDNQITGEIPKWIWEVSSESLSYLNLSCNLLVDLEKPYTMPTGLLVLDLHSNKLQGDFPLPPETATYVDYSSNKFNNSISSDIGHYISSTFFFSLSNNGLTGVIPASICNASYLQVLDLSNNNLSGRMPNCLFENMEFLGVLNLGRNHLSGAILDNFSGSCALETLDLSRNDLEGKIPGSLVNCTSLEVLNIGSNRIEDTFPCMLKNSSNLRVLVLRSNRFHGILNCSNYNGSWPHLQIIDIASNKFSGDLSPKCFSIWRGMMAGDESGQDHLRFDFLKFGYPYYQDTVTVTFKGLELELVKILTFFTSIDLSCNNFEGNIPETIGELKELYVLNLSNNALTGTIPKSFGNLKQLGSLDLSMNHLSGIIPAELAGLTFLSFLNLSFNQFLGKIPEGGQFPTFTETSFEQNKGLCGFPLNISCNDKNDTLVPSSETKFDWQFIFIGLGFGVGAAVIVASLIICKEGRDWTDKHLERILLLIFPRYRFSYTRYDEGKIGAVENSEDELPGYTEDSDEEDEYEVEDEAFRGKYCVFCSKLDVHREGAVHDLKCICHTSPPPIYFPSTTSSSPLLVLHHHQHF
ncbi:hypothetical protein ACH5RR_005192 [Cinchona calisaya]|uniref:Leucine-rich repeat-containing N-terminal plant-type domain-containing protein n=1 Tax=Cinchona calisaya TaxID=153742 RepID=A0ABD3AKJ6_9GENT